LSPDPFRGGIAAGQLQGPGGVKEKLDVSLIESHTDLPSHRLEENNRYLWKDDYKTQTTVEWSSRSGGREGQHHQRPDKCHRSVPVQVFPRWRASCRPADTVATIQLQTLTGFAFPLFITD